MNKQALFAQRSQWFDCIEMRMNALRDTITSLTRGVSTTVSTSKVEIAPIELEKATPQVEATQPDVKAMAASFDFGALNLDLSDISL